MKSVNNLSLANISYCQNFNRVNHQRQEFGPPFIVGQLQFSSTIFGDPDLILNEHAPQNPNATINAKLPIA